ncbi:MAG: metallophosphoesterase [Reyranellaceae bacterium]
MSSWRQLTLIHLTDLHFGPRHAFKPPVPPDGHPAVARGWPKLLESLTRDWMTGVFADRGPPPTPSGYPPARRRPDGTRDPNTRVVVAITGDLTETSLDTEFDDASKFVEQCAKSMIFGWQMSVDDIFVVPGNHDLQWAQQTPQGRWMPFAYFYGTLRDKNINAAKPEELTRLIDQSEDGLIVAEINSSAYMQKANENRGQVDPGAIASLRDALDKIDQEKRRRAIKVALVHHHPVHLPGLAEASEGYSALVNSNALLERLRSYGFHLILHGHKHMPYTFWYDPACAWIGNPAYPLMIAAGGTAGSTEYQAVPGATNTYNVITLRWDPMLDRVRIHVETRGLVRTSENNQPLDPDRWQWRTLRVADRSFDLPRSAPKHEAGEPRVATQAEIDVLEPPRQAAIEHTRRNFPVVDILPSLDPEQFNEARVRIEGQVEGKGYEAPTRVEWWAGPSFKDVVAVTHEQDETFAARFTYWWPTLIQCRLHWKDGKSALAHIFVPQPADRPQQDSGAQAVPAPQAAVPRR